MQIPGLVDPPNQTVYISFSVEINVQTTESLIATFAGLVARGD
jgi:hypothetical protein